MRIGTVMQLKLHNRLSADVLMLQRIDASYWCKVEFTY